MDAKVRAILERPFEANLLKQRQGPGGQVFTYVEVQHYIDRLNEAFGGDWSLENVRREVVEDQVVVEVRLTAGGVVKTGLGGGAVTRRRDNNRLVSLADDFKKGEADAIKRACRLLGIGGNLYGGETPDVEVEDQPHDDRWSARSAGADPAEREVARPRASPVSTAPARTRLSSKQLAALWALAEKRGIERSAFRARVRARYACQPEFLSKSQASELITILTANGNGSADGHELREPGEEG